MVSMTHFEGNSKEEEKDEAGDEVVMNNLMHDIKEGFIQRRLPDGGFKVRTIYFLSGPEVVSMLRQYCFDKRHKGWLSMSILNILRQTDLRH